MLAKSSVEKMTEIEANDIFIHGELRYGNKWEIGDQAKVSKRELSAWKRAFAQAYTEAMGEKLDRLIPEEICDKLEWFCALVGSMFLYMEWGESPKRGYGVRLGDETGFLGKSSKKPETPKIRPSREMIVSMARRSAKNVVGLDWTTFIHDPAHPILHHEDTLIGGIWPREWEMTEEDKDLWKHEQHEVYLDILRKNIRAFAPREAWAKASLICLVYDRMVEEGVIKPLD